ncbi:MAG: hypothetical protein PHT91_03775, partial [Candidatus Nanoarchaeia archaeon]|nr:hypothetical protein [Candidatus Nanoarchaeia archaeon]
MGLKINQLLIGDKNSYLDKILINDSFVLDENDDLNVYLILLSMNNLLKSNDSSIESVSNISLVKNDVFSDYFALKKRGYRLIDENKTYGFGKYFHACFNEKFGVVSIEDVDVDCGPAFIINHPIIGLAGKLSRKFDYDSCKGVCDFEGFDFEKNLSKKLADENYVVKIIGLGGHIHHNGCENYFNETGEFFMKERFFDGGLEKMSDFIKIFREFS